MKFLAIAAVAVSVMCGWTVVASENVPQLLSRVGKSTEIFFVNQKVLFNLPAIMGTYTPREFIERQLDVPRHLLAQSLANISYDWSNGQLGYEAKLQAAEFQNISSALNSLLSELIV